MTFDFFRKHSRGSRKQRKRSQPQTVRPRFEHLEGRDLPAPLTWAAGASLPTASGGAVAVQSSAGATVILGGSSGLISVPTFAAANPAWQATFVYTTPLDQSRLSPGVGVLPDGTYMVFGGQDAFGESLASVYNSNGASASMHSARYELGFATDENHLVYAIGGLDSDGNALKSMEVYSQSSNTWTVLAPLPKSLAGLSAVGDQAGHIFAFGGMDGSGQISSNVYRYTINTNKWDSVASLPVATENSAAVLASNGLIYVLGGITPSGTTTQTTANVESYDENADAWTVQTALPAPVSSEAATVDSLGRIVVADGFDANNIATNSVYVSQELNQPDAAPVITSTPNGLAYANQVYGYQVLSTGNPPPTYTLTASPAGMTIDSNTGLISWTATPNQVGSYSVTVQASNFAGSATQTYTVAVVPPAPTGLTATGASTSSIALAWNAVYDPAGVTYTVTEQKWVSNGGGKGSHGGHYVYTTIATGVTTASYTVTGLATGSTHSYYVSAVDLATGIQTAHSVVASGQTWYLPTLSPFVLWGGAVFSNPNATVGQPISVSMISTGNPAPTFSILSGPSTLSIDPNTGIVTYTPDGSTLGLVNYTVQAANPVGSVQQTYGFNVLPAPTIIFSDGPFTFNGFPFYATATAVGSDGVTPVAGSFTFSYSGPSNPPSFAGTYTVFATFTSGDPNYGSTTATSTMIINPATAVFGGLRSPIIPVGQNSVYLPGTLLDGTTGPASGTVDITLNGVTHAASLRTGDVFSATLNTTGLAAGAYTVTYAYVPGDPDFTAQNATSTLYVGSKPKVTTQPVSQTVTAGSTVTFTAAASGAPWPWVLWQVSSNGGLSYTRIAGATSRTLTFTAKAGQNGYVYRAVFTNVIGSVTTSSATLTVTAAAALPLNSVALMGTGQRLPFTATIANSPQPILQQQVGSHDGSLSAGIIQSSRTIPDCPKSSHLASSGKNKLNYLAAIEFWLMSEKPA